jgi:hypothetical protein
MLDVMALSFGGEPETAMEERAMSARLISVGWHQSWGCSKTKTGI